MQSPSELENKLAAYGVDISSTMARFVDDMELYRSCLSTFLEDPGYDRLQQALAVQDYTAAFHEAHTLKGVSGNMGLTPLFNAVCVLVEALRAKDYRDLDAQYRAVLTQKACVEQLLQ